MDAHAIPQEFIFIDEAGFNLAKTRRRGRNLIGHRAIIDVPGQRGGNITTCAAISNMHGVLHRHANLGPHNIFSYFWIDFTTFSYHQSV